MKTKFNMKSFLNDSESNFSWRYAEKVYPHQSWFLNNNKYATFEPNSRFTLLEDNTTKTQKPHPYNQLPI